MVDQTDQVAAARHLLAMFPSFLHQSSASNLLILHRIYFYQQGTYMQALLFITAQYIRRAQSLFFIYIHNILSSVLSSSCVVKEQKHTNQQNKDIIGLRIIQGFFWSMIYNHENAANDFHFISIFFLEVLLLVLAAWLTSRNHDRYNSWFTCQIF